MRPLFGFSLIPLFTDHINCSLLIVRFVKYNVQVALVTVHPSAGVVVLEAAK